MIFQIKPGFCHIIVSFPYIQIGAERFYSCRQFMAHCLSLIPRLLPAEQRFCFLMMNCREIEAKKALVWSRSAFIEHIGGLILPGFTLILQCAVIQSKGCIDVG